MTELKGWKDIPAAGVCWAPATEYKTGDWRAFKPIRDLEKCNNCLICYIYCPEGCIEWTPETEELTFDYDYCKGCGICAHECPRDAIKMERE